MMVVGADPRPIVVLQQGSTHTGQPVGSGISVALRLKKFKEYGHSLH